MAFALYCPYLTISITGEFNIDVTDTEQKVAVDAIVGFNIQDDYELRPAPVYYPALCQPSCHYAATLPKRIESVYKTDEETKLVNFTTITEDRRLLFAHGEAENRLLSVVAMNNTNGRRSVYAKGVSAIAHRFGYVFVLLNDRAPYSQCYRYTMGLFNGCHLFNAACPGPLAVSYDKRVMVTEQHGDTTAIKCHDLNGIMQNTIYIKDSSAPLDLYCMGNGDLLTRTNIGLTKYRVVDSSTIKLWRMNDTSLRQVSLDEFSYIYVILQSAYMPCIGIFNPHGKFKFV